MILAPYNYQICSILGHYLYQWIDSHPPSPPASRRGGGSLCGNTWIMYSILEFQYDGMENFCALKYSKLERFRAPK